LSFSVPCFLENTSGFFDVQDFRGVEQLADLADVGMGLPGVVLERRGHRCAVTGKQGRDRSFDHVAVEQGGGQGPRLDQLAGQVVPAIRCD